MAGRQAWCPRCDELREARPGAACPVCGRHLLAVPPARPGQPQPATANRLGRRLRGLLPAAGAAGAGLLVAAAVASAFAAGRLTRTTPSGPAAAPATTVSGFVDEGPVTGRRDFGWHDEDGGIRVQLRSTSVGTGFTRLELRVDGVTRGRQVSALTGLRVRDADGNDLLPGGAVASISTASSQRAGGGGVHTEVVLDRALDPQAVASVEFGGLTVGARVEERLQGYLVDRKLQANPDPDNADRAQGPVQPRDCPTCLLRVRCPGCRTARVAATAYRHGLIMVLLEAIGPPERSAVNPSRRRVVVTGEGGIAELQAWIDGTGETAALAINAAELAASGPSDRSGSDQMRFEVAVEARAEQAIRGRWAIRQPGASG
jgi:hypothetical protein